MTDLHLLYKHNQTPLKKRCGYLALFDFVSQFKLGERQARLKTAAKKPSIL